MIPNVYAEKLYYYVEPLPDYALFANNVMHLSTTSWETANPALEFIEDDERESEEEEEELVEHDGDVEAENNTKPVLSQGSVVRNVKGLTSSKIIENNVTSSSAKFVFGNKSVWKGSVVKSLVFDSIPPASWAKSKKVKWI